jgi:hypothetical protein
MEDLKDRLYSHAQTHSDSKDLLVKAALYIDALEQSVEDLRAARRRENQVMQQYKQIVDI